MKRIHNSLNHVFLRHRIVFWYDATGEWMQTFEAFDHNTVTKIKVAGTEFGTKVRVVRDPNPEAKFLIYIPTARPADADNWLLDLLLQGYEYKADRASLALQEVGLPYEFLFLAEEHAIFFKNQQQIQALKNLIRKDDTAKSIRLKMVAVLAGTEVDISALLLRFLDTPVETVLLDPIAECFDAAALTVFFWKEVAQAFGYASNAPSLRDFAVAVFRAANPLDTATALHPHVKVFLQRWKDSQKYCGSFERWSRQMEAELQVAGSLTSLEKRVSLSDCDTFEIFDKYTLHQLCLCFANNVAAIDLQAVIQKRRASFWQKKHAHGYAALSHALELRELLASAELTIDSPAAGISRYVNTWWRIDAAYRNCVWHLRRYGQTQLMEQVTQWVDKSYVNNFLLPLSDRWSDQVRKMNVWECEGVAEQRDFFELYVMPYLSKGQKVFVIISDALRFEAAADFAMRLRVENRWTTELESLLGSLPSYTQLGMAALLPGRELAVTAATGAVLLDGHNTTGTLERAKILNQACNGSATAILSSAFLELNTKTAGRDLMRDHEVIYIYHGTIDKQSHSVNTEEKTFNNVEQAFSELELIVKKVANINGTNMLLTADHGFLFQQNIVDKMDDEPLPDADSLEYQDRRFILGHGIRSSSKIKVFDSDSLKLQGNWSAAFPLSLGRFPLSGAGKRFVHGGTALQEIVVPVVKIHKARSDDTGRVEVILLHVPTMITTGQFSITLFQEKPATDKVLPRTLRIGVYAKDNTLLSEIKTVSFESREPEARRREMSLVLALSHAADTFNNSDVDLRLEETLQGTNQTVIYRAHLLKIQKPFTSDFDEN